jgi:hypothetical protein
MCNCVKCLDDDKVDCWNDLFVMDKYLIYIFPNKILWDPSACFCQKDNFFIAIFKTKFCKLLIFVAFWGYVINVKTPFYAKIQNFNSIFWNAKKNSIFG